LITSRMGIRHRALPQGSCAALDSAEVTLTEGEYGPEKCKQILELYLADCVPWQRDLVIMRR